jgi:hypothetical protein
MTSRSNPKKVHIPIQASEEVLGTLRDFQRRTATYAFDQLFNNDHPRDRFLVADEVGLGKTFVAKGIIAQVAEHLRSKGDDRIDIVYICSNRAIATQNLRKLDITDHRATSASAHIQTHSVDRLSMLLARMHHLDQRDFNLISITPGTSLNMGNRSGKWEERRLLFALLERIWGQDALGSKAAKRLFLAQKSDNDYSLKALRNARNEFEIATGAVQLFRDELRQLNVDRENSEPRRVSLKVEFNQLVKVFKDSRGRKIDKAAKAQQTRFLGELRHAMARVGIKLLHPDLIILDEFQRFRDLLETPEIDDDGVAVDDNPAAMLARELFESADRERGTSPKMLLLSATPYRPFTTSSDRLQDDHHKDFLHTVKFLLGGTGKKIGQLSDSLGSLRTSLRNLPSVIDDHAKFQQQLTDAEASCEQVASILRPVMARTERLSSTSDRNGMVTQRDINVDLTASDIAGYLAISRISKSLNELDTTEYWKSAPFLLNFMEGYKFKKAFTDKFTDSPEDFATIVEKGSGFLSWSDVQSFRPIDPGNSRLRAVTADTTSGPTSKMLWLAPSLPYWEPEGIFAGVQAQSFTKQLIFSSWNVVPKVVSSFLSYSAEREIYRDPKSGQIPRRYRRSEVANSQPIRFNRRGERFAHSSLILVLPFIEFAQLTDPLPIVRRLHSQKLPVTSDAVEEEVRVIIQEAIRPYLQSVRADGPEDQSWYWALPLMLDRAVHGDSIAAWLRSSDVHQGIVGDKQVDSDFVNQLSRLADEIDSEEFLDQLGRPPSDLEEVLVACALGSPALCALRSLNRVNESEVDFDTRRERITAAAQMAWGMRSLFNSPEAEAILKRNTESHLPFWRLVFEYSIQGNLQSVFDEYVNSLTEWRGLIATSEVERNSSIASTFTDAVSLRGVTYEFHDFAPQPGMQPGEFSTRKMRGNYAIRFGAESTESDQRVKRDQQSNIAFNSPFWPFVMTSTSIGQEGLDFHLYSHAIVHWNLPSNPVDFEQREGRVHRYRGHAIRKNVAYFGKDVAFTGNSQNPWDDLYAEAERIRPTNDEIWPNWVFNPEGSPARIERIVPMLPMSRDALRLESLIKGVTTYRLSFGQPRQEELLEFLGDRLTSDQLAEISQRVRVDLSPPSSA